MGKCVAQVDRSFLEVFYVSSDTTDAEMKAFQPDGIQGIPFHKADQRQSLKQHFRTCAAKEMEGLGITERKNGIPTLILIETATGRVITESAHDDVMKDKSSEQMVAQWKSLL